MKTIVRFWEYINNGWVKLALLPGQPINWSCFNRTEEGWASETRRYEYDGSIVNLSLVTDSRDCDGRFTRIWEGYFDPDAEREPCFMGYDPYGDEIVSTTMKCPVWQGRTSRQRDYSAEAAGY